MKPNPQTTQEGQNNRRTLLMIGGKLGSRPYPFADRCHRGLEPIVELAVDYVVPNVGCLALDVQEVGGGANY
jgi:hypothetical protein